MTVEQYDQIVKLCKEEKTNDEISKIMGIPYQTLLLWKRKIRENGDIDESKRGRKASPKNICKNCGEVIACKNCGYPL